MNPDTALTLITFVAGILGAAALAVSVIERRHRDLVLQQELSRVQTVTEPSLYNASWERQIEAGKIANILIQYPGAIEIILALADEGPLDLKKKALITTIPGNLLPDTIGQLARENLIALQGTTIRLSTLGILTVEKLRGYLAKGGMLHDALD